MKAQPSKSLSSASADSWTLSGNLYQDERLKRTGVVHGVTTRALGDMKDAQSRGLALNQAGLGKQPHFLLKQVHGVAVVNADGALSQTESPQADGWITRTPGRSLCVFIADCMPIFIWEDSARIVGLFHAGWRGAELGMPREAVSSFKKFYGIAPELLKAAIGPHIGACCYKVGAELAERFRPSSLRSAEGSVFLDLAAEARAQMIEAGMDGSAINENSQCTACHPELFYSFRREKWDRRMMAFIELPPMVP